MANRSGAFVIDDMSFGYFDVALFNGIEKLSLTYIIPAGSTYKLACDNYEDWYELR